jgi:hypothetical protein
MSRNPKKREINLKTGLNEIEFCWKKARTDANADTHLSSFKFVVETVSISGLVGKTLAPKSCRFYAVWDQIPVRVITIFPLFPSIFFLLSHPNLLLY